MRTSFFRLVLGMLFFCILACKKKQETPQASADVIVQPIIIPVILSNIDTTGCKQSLFAPCIVTFNASDSIYSKDGILHMYAQNKTNQLFTSLSTYNQPIKGDFELDISVAYDISYSTKITSKPGYYIFNLSNSTKSVRSIIYQEAKIWLVGNDTLQFRPNGQIPKGGSDPCPNEIQYHISRKSNTLIAKQFFCRDSLVKEILDFGDQDIDLSFVLSCDTSATDYSKMKVTNLELKIGNGIVKSESFCGNRNFNTK